jgi:hypothetical protein
MIPGEHPAWSSLTWGLTLVVCAALAGCAGLKKAQPEAAAPADPDTPAAFREPGPPGQMLGIDERAREIERHLGIR